MNAANTADTHSPDTGRCHQSSILSPEGLRRYVESFHSHVDVRDGHAVPDEAVADWMERNVPRFECPDKEIEEIYYFRWWTFRKHLKVTPDGYVITEFLPDVPWAGKHNTISCPAGHHYYEGRWIHDTRYLDDYSRFWLRKGGEPRRYSFWIADAFHARACVTQDLDPAVELLPQLVANFDAWEASHLGENGLFWQEDDRDGMECSISGKLAPDHTGYRATINSYMYGDAMAIAAIAESAGDARLADVYRRKAREIRARVLDLLWDDSAGFFKVLPRCPDIKPASPRGTCSLGKRILDRCVHSDNGHKKQ